MDFDPADFDQAFRDEGKLRRQGAGLMFAASASAMIWAGVVGGGALHQFGMSGLGQAPLETLGSLAALGLGPALIMLFAGVAGREAARARAAAERLAQIATQALATPAPEAAAAASQASQELQDDMLALDTVLRGVNEHLRQVNQALREDSGELAQTLKGDIETMRAVRNELRAEAEALGVSVNRSVKQLRDTSAYMKSEAGAAERALAGHLQAYVAAFAQINTQSDEFAAAADKSAEAAGRLDAAIARSLEALAHATSLNDGARKSAVEASEAAAEAARAIREAVSRAVLEARDAARSVRAENARPAEARRYEAANEELEQADYEPAAARKISMAEFFRVKAQPPAAPANDRFHGDARTLADIAALSGIAAGEALSASDLEHIARAGRAGPEARRSAVRNAAPAPVRRLSNQLRRDRMIRRQAERLRAEPSRALGDDAGLDATARRDLASAYLLVDAALG
ncbi:MAG: hypothetical protein AB7M12_05880 [Hyphomonadaceae bacterium]